MILSSSLVTNHTASETVDLITGKLTVQIDEQDLPLHDLCGFAARNNPKRGFLFVSKVLGKHWPVRPQVMQDIHHRLAAKLPHDLPSPVLFIAMAETATGLGQGIFESFLSGASSKADYLFIHSTRYRIAGLRNLAFQETHSHSTDFFLYEPADSVLKTRFSHAKTLVLIDDELSTGNTFINLVEAYRNTNPGLEQIFILSITNFIDAERRQQINDAVDLPIRFIQLLSGKYHFEKKADLVSFGAADVRGNGEAKNAIVSLCSGRVGIGAQLKTDFSEVMHSVLKMQDKQRILVLGTGEFMHGAFLLARQLENAGYDVCMQSTTRSPILCGQAIQEIMQFRDNYADDIPNFLYNVNPDSYNAIFICHETPVCDSLRELAEKLNAELVNCS